MKTIVFILMIIIIITSGCATSYGPSSYENYSRDGVNYVKANGQAASNAAWVHTSNASLGGANASSSGRSYGSGYGQDPYSQRSVIGETSQSVYRSAVSTVGSELSSAIGSTIRDAFR